MQHLKKLETNLKKLEKKLEKNVDQKKFKKVQGYLPKRMYNI